MIIDFLIHAISPRLSASAYWLSFWCIIIDYFRAQYAVYCWYLFSIITYIISRD